MAETAEEILELLERRQLVSEKMLGKLRKKVESASRPVSARKLARLLLDKGLVTPVQAKQLLKAEVDPANSAQQPGIDDASRAEPGVVANNSHSPSAQRKDDEALDLGLKALDDEDEILDSAVVATDLDDEILPLDALDGAAGYENDLQANRTAGFDHDPLVTSLDAPAPRRVKSIARVTNRWDSKLILGGSGLLILLVVLGVFLFYVVTRGTAEDQFKLGETAYNSGNYMQAILDFDKYLDKFPKDTRVSEARVRIGLAQMWQEAEVARNWKKALETANATLPAIESEESFAKTARPELAGLLATVADGFAEQARTSGGDEAAELVVLYEQTMVLVDNSSYVPSTQRRSQQKKLDDVEAKILTIKRNINRERELKNTIAKIDEASASGDPQVAYIARDNLLAIYPALEDHLELQGAIRKISGRQREFVEISEERLISLTADEEPPRHVALPSQTGGKAEGVDGHVLYYLAGGALYGIDASNGRALWRRFVGHESEIPPVPLGTQPGSDVLYVDVRTNELVRRGARDGSLVWRLPIEEPLLESIVLPDRLVSTTQSGRILLVDLQQGTSRRQVQLPQPLNVRPGIDEKHGRIYAAADHSNLYVLDAETLACDEVYYVGHSTGGISGPAVSALGIVFVPERLSPDFSQLHVLKTDDNGLGLYKVQDPLRLEGHVVQPPIVLGRRLLVTTNLGVIYLFEIDKGDDSKPITKLTETVKTRDQSIVPQSVIADGHLWVGDMRLTSYQIQSSRGSIVRQRVLHNGDAFVGPMRTIGNVLFHMRQRREQAGLTVMASYIGRQETEDADTKSIWEIDLAVPPAGEPLSQGGSKVIMVSSQAELFEVDPEKIRHGVQGHYKESITALQTMDFDTVLPLKDGRFVFVNEKQPEKVLWLDPSVEENRLRAVELKIPESSFPTYSTVMGGSLLSVSQVGQIFLFELPSGESKTDPFQPRLRPGERVDWQVPAVVEGPDQQAVVYDGRHKLYRIGIRMNTRPQLVAQAERAIDCTLDGGLAALADTVYGVVRGMAADQMVSFSVSDLSPGKQWDLTGHVVWGPIRVGHLVMAATDAQKLYCFQDGQKMSWTAEMPYGPIVGNPLLSEESIILAALSGTIWRVALDSGQEIGHVVVGETLGTGPVHWDAETILLAGHDGTMYSVAAP